MAKCIQIISVSTGGEKCNSCQTTMKSNDYLYESESLRVLGKDKKEWQLWFDQMNKCSYRGWEEVQVEFMSVVVRLFEMQVLLCVRFMRKHYCAIATKG